MTKEEFMERFGDGKTKIRFKPWDNSNYWVIPSLFGIGMFGGVQQNGGINLYDYNGAWQLYKEPKPEFDFDKPYMWIKKSLTVYLSVKTSFITWRLIDDHADSISARSKKEVLESFQPTNQPDNWEDYGLKESDINL